MQNKLKQIAGEIILFLSLPFYLFTVLAFFLTTVIGFTGDTYMSDGKALLFRIAGALFLLFNCSVTYFGISLMQDKPIKRPLLLVVACLGLFILIGIFTSK